MHHKSPGNRPLLAAILILSTLSALRAKGSIADVLSSDTSVADFEITDRQVITTRQEMYDYLDGGAELYFDHRWESLVAFDLRRQDHHEFKAEIYRVNTHQDAMELLATQKDLGDTLQVGDKSYYGAGMVVWVQGNLYVRLWSWDVYETVRQDATALAIALSNRLRDTE